MRAIHFEESNITFNKPESMTDEECMPLHAYAGVDQKGDPFINTVWMPNKEDIKAINAGRAVILSVCGSGIPPLSLFTCDENGNINE